jgi:two-component system, LytTR family, sensor kinase
VTAAITLTPLLVLVAIGASYWPLRRGMWLRHVLPMTGLFVSYSVIHTVTMEGLRALVRPLLGRSSPFTAESLQWSILHELPNDLFYFALLVSAVELWQFWWQATVRERNERERQRLFTEAQLTSLRLQLQPHFLFNALNTVSATMYEDTRRADSMLGDLAELLRASLRRPKNDLVPLGEELAIADHYITLQQARFGDRLTVARAIDPSCLDTLVPVLILQPLIENAVRHGRVERVGVGTVRLSATVVDGLMSLEVWDDGGESIGPASKGHGIGLQSTAERLRLLFGETASIFAGPVHDGWVVRMAIPSPSHHGVAPCL